MMTSLINFPEWHVLQSHHASLKQKWPVSVELPLVNITLDNALRLAGFYQNLTHETLHYLIDLANASHLKQGIENLFQGEIVNPSENLPALHTALRSENLSSDMQKNREKVRLFSDKIVRKAWLGYTGKPVKNILHIGIGGSDLGQRLTCQALEGYANLALSAGIQLHFVANIDPDEMDMALKKLDPETTLIILASKSFSTLETQMNMDKAVAWMEVPQAIFQQIIVITAYPDRVLARYSHINLEYILTIPLGVGGRYSIWSAMGLVLSIWIGFENFEAFLNGAQAMDLHFRTVPFEQNIPVLMALMGIWNINFVGCGTQAIIPYAQRLSHFPAYLQQLDMESNGKSITISGETVNYATGPIIWGGVGSNSQHSFHQLLHQGTHTIPVDFIKVQSFDAEKQGDAYRHCLNVNCDTQAQVMANNPHCFVNMITLNGLTPFTLGALMALYEHKIFVQSQIWQINPFDQPGVEEAKVLAKKMLRDNAAIRQSTHECHPMRDALKLF